MHSLTLQELTAALRKAWNAETSYTSADAWTKNNPARGQCVVSSLIVQDYFGGDIARYEVKGEGIDETHYYNILSDGTTLDTTGSQYNLPVSMKSKPFKPGVYPSLRTKRLDDEDTRGRYLLLKSRVETVLASE